MKTNLLRSVLEARCEKDLILLFERLGHTAALVYKELPHHIGSTISVNIYGDRQTKLDLWTNGKFIETLLETNLVGRVASEESEEIQKAGGKFAVTLDPLDGSSNIEANNLLGTIFGVYGDIQLPARGRLMEAAGYFLYGPYCQMVLAVKGAVYKFILIPGLNDFMNYLGNEERWVLPMNPKIYGVGGNRVKWPSSVKTFVEYLEQKGLKLRYGGSLVGDFNQILQYGGFFAYPALTDAPEGRYRLQFEANPMAFIIEQAGGTSTDGKKNILDVEPTSLHQQTPIYLGNTELVEILVNLNHRMGQISNPT